MNEITLMHRIMCKLSDNGFGVFRANVGRVKMPDGRYFATGLPKGFSDLFAVKDGKAYFLEVKVKPNKPTREQAKFLRIMHNRYGAVAGVVYSIDDALGLCGCVEADT